MDPVAQGRGIGHALLAHVEAEVRARGGRLLLIETSDGLGYASARRLYETGGYHCEAVVHDFYAPGDSLLIFSKILEPAQPISDAPGEYPQFVPTGDELAPSFVLAE